MTGALSRRRFLATALPLIALPRPSAAQGTGQVPRIAYLSPSLPPSHPATTNAPHHVAFDAEMGRLGYVEGRNVVILRRFLRKRLNELDEAMREILGLNVDVIVAWAIQLAEAAKRATSTVPIVFIAVRGPVERGLVPSLARPGGNITGISTYPVETIDPKLFEVAKELMPQVARVAVLRSTADPPGAAARQEDAARALGFKLVPIPFSHDEDVAAAPARIERSTAQILIAPDSPLLYGRRNVIIDAAARKRLPTIYAFREAAVDGGLMALSTDLEELARRGAAYVDKVLKGTKPGILPVEQPTRLAFVINLKTAKAQGVTIPPSLRLRADQVIE